MKGLKGIMHRRRRQGREAAVPPGNLAAGPGGDEAGRSTKAARTDASPFLRTVGRVLCSIPYTPLPTYTPPPTPSPTASLLPTPTVTGTPTPTVTATPVPLSAAQLVGNWINVLAYTPSVPQVTILANADGSYAVHGYGSCSPTYCDWGVTPLIGVPGSATAVAQFDNGNTLVLSLSGNELRVDDHRTSGPVTTDYLVRA